MRGEVGIDCSPILDQLLQAGCSMASYLTPLCFNFFIRTMGIIQSLPQNSYM